MITQYALKMNSSSTKTSVVKSGHALFRDKGWGWQFYESAGGLDLIKHERNTEFRLFSDRIMELIANFDMSKT